MKNAVIIFDSQKAGSYSDAEMTTRFAAKHFYDAAVIAQKAKNAVGSSAKLLNDEFQYRLKLAVSTASLAYDLINEAGTMYGFTIIDRDGGEMHTSEAEYETWDEAYEAGNHSLCDLNGGSLEVWFDD